MKPTPALITAISSDVRKGSHPPVAAAAAGVPRNTYLAWMERGRRDEGTATDSPERAFRAALIEAEAYSEQVLLRLIYDLADGSVSAGNLRAACWILERRFPSRWGEGVKAAAQQVEYLKGLLGKLKEKLGSETHARVIEALDDCISPTEGVPSGLSAGHSTH